MSLFAALKNGKNGVRPVGHRSVEWSKPFVCNKTATPGWGYVEEKQLLALSH